MTDASPGRPTWTCVSCATCSATPTTGGSGDPDLPVYRYVKNWGRRGDAGVIASAGPNAYGAAWYRLFPASAPGFGFVDEETPELTIAVVPSKRGHGTGAELLEALLAQASDDGFSRISLSAEPGQTGVLREVRLP